MYLFIATIFIAELIIALTIVFYIIKADKFVLEYDNKLLNVRPKIQIGLLTVREFTLMLAEKTSSLFDFARKKRNEYILGAVKTVLIYLMLFLFKGKCKRAAALCQGIVLAKDFWESVSA